MACPLQLPDQFRLVQSVGDRDVAERAETRQRASHASRSVSNEDPVDWSWQPQDVRYAGTWGDRFQSHARKG